MKVLVIYWSATGNTEKVANAIQRSLAHEKLTPEVMTLPEAEDIDLYDYDLVFLGSPTYMYFLPEPVLNFIKKKAKHYGECGAIKPGAPEVPGKSAVVFCTYSGPHTGINEAIPVGKYLGQFFEHLGFEVKREWYIVGEFHGREDFSTIGRLGNIKGRPNEEDLAKVENDVRELIKSIRAEP